MQNIRSQILDMLAEAMENATTPEECEGLQRAIDIIEEVLGNV